MEDHQSIQEELKSKLEFISSFEIKLKNCSDKYFSSINTYDKLKEIKVEKESLKNELNTIKNWRKSIESSKSSYKKSKILISLYNDFSQTCAKILSDFETFEREFNSNTRYFYHLIFTPGFYNLIIYDTETNIKSKKTVKAIQSLIHEHTLTIFLPNSKVFMYGSIHIYYGLTYIFDLKTHEAEEMPKGLPLIRSGGIYHKNSIYLFGGITYEDCFDRAFPPHAQRFDMNDWKWKEIPIPPKETLHCRCAIFNDTILIYGCKWTSIYQYDIEILSYSEIIFDGKQSDEDIRKIVLFVGNSRVYVGEFGAMLYESEPNDVYNWNPIGTIDKIKPYQGNKRQILRNAVIFNDIFLLKKDEFLRFDLARKEIQKL